MSIRRLPHLKRSSLFFTVKGEKRSITLTLPSLFSQAREEALELDDLVEGFIDEAHYDFIDGYFAVRNINNHRGGRSKKEESGQPATNQ